MKNEAKLFLAANDKVLGKIINKIELPIFESTRDAFHDLMSCILEQQIHYRSTKKVFQKMLERASIERLNPENFEEFEEKALANANLSIAKFETVVGILEFWDENKIDWQTLSDSEVFDKLSSIKGIGKWSVDMILLYTLERANVFPYDDFHLKQVMVNLYGLNAKSRLKAQMIEVANNWGEHKSMAVRYLLAWKEIIKLDKKLVKN
jgi:DNA-3-methyladenine glycosylase II